MKKILTIISLNFFILSFSMLNLNAQDESGNSFSSPKFQVLLSGGFGYVTGNSDMEDISEAQGQSAANQYNAIAAAIPAPGGFEVDSTSKANLAYGLDLEMRFFGENLGLGLGVGIHGTDSTTKVSSPNYSDKIEYELLLTTLPLMATLYYKKPLTENSFAVFGAGAGYYYAALDGELSSNATIPWQVNVSEPIADATTIGYHLKADYNYMLGPVSFTVGVMGRYVQFDEFKDGGAIYKIDAGLTGVSSYIAVGFAL